MSDTIVAIATAHGVASISIIRLSGAKALEIARKIAPKASLSPRYAQLCDLFDATGSLIDRGIVLRFQAPASFTGEEVVEFQVHGGLIVAEQILQSALSHGARLAQAGEFSKRAFLNGKIDLSEAEAIAKMIEAKSADAARILARQIKGELGIFVEESRQRLLRALAHSEVMIDYAEEDIPDDLIGTLSKQLLELKGSLEKIVESSRRRKGLIEGFRVAIIGKPNVGKSSLLNRLLSYERAIVSDQAGTTRDTIEEQIRIASHIVRIIDTAGIRQTDDQIERIGVERSLNSLREADIVVALFDASSSWEDEDRQILEKIKAIEGKELIVVLNKSDLERRLDISPLQPFNPIYMSAKEDATPLISRLKEILDAFGADEEILLASARQIEAVLSCAREIDEALEPLREGELELFSYHIREALRAISSITRAFESEEILDQMFSEFCLGK